MDDDGEIPGGDADMLDLIAPGIKVRKTATGFTVEYRERALAFTREDAPDLDALLDVLTAIRRDLTGEDFVPSKPTPTPQPGPTAFVTFDEEHLEILRARVRVGKEESLDAAVRRAVRHYLRHLFAHPDEADRPAPGQRRLTEGAPAQAPVATPRARAPRDGALGGVGPIQRTLLTRALRRGHLTRLDVGQAYGIRPGKRGASSGRARAEAQVHALVARGLLRQETRGADTVWVLTATGRAAAEEVGPPE